MYKIFILFLFINAPLWGQNNILSDKNILKGIIYKNEFSIEAKLHTLGFAVGFNRGKIVSYHTTKFYHFDIGHLKSIKEKKNNFVATSLNIYNNYSFAKRNYFFPTRLGMGIKKYLSEKQSYKGIAVGYSIEGGFTLGVLKPYYLDVKSLTDDNKFTIETIKYSEENKDVFIDENQIFDKASFFKGFGEIDFVPGVHLNAAILYALKAYEKPVYAIQTGIMIDAFIKHVPIMVETSGFKNKSIFFNVYINIQLGKRWN